MESLNININPCYTGLSTTIPGIKDLFMQDNQRQTHWAYIAGVMDSDGCFMITKHNRKTKRKDYPHQVEQWSAVYLASVKICQIEPEAVYFIKDIMKYGTISLYGARPSRPNSKPIYQWGIRKRSDLIPFLENILPYLKIKKHKAEFLLNYCKTAKIIPIGYFGIDKDELNYREESYRKMRELNGNKVAATTNPSKCESISDSLNMIEKS